MDIHKIRDLIVERVKASPAIRKRIHKYAKDAPESLKPEDLAGFEPWLANQDLNQYLTECLVPGGYIASGMAVHDLRDIRDETVEGAGPGGFILPFGYLVIAGSAGGNQLCVGTDGRVYWADHEGFGVEVTYKNPETGHWESLAFTPENVLRGLVPVAEQFEPFLVSLLTEQSEQQLRELD